MPEHKENRQYAPWPSDLEALVAMARHHHGWRFELVDEERDPASTHGASAGGLTLEIIPLCAQSYQAKICETCGSAVTDYRVRFLYPVPAATWNRQSWLDWLFDCVEHTGLHETREAFRLEWTEIVDGKQVKKSEVPFAPMHAPGDNFTRRVSYATDLQRRTNFRGIVKESVEDV